MSELIWAQSTAPHNSYTDGCLNVTRSIQSVDLSGRQTELKPEVPIVHIYCYSP